MAQQITDNNPDKFQPTPNSEDIPLNEVANETTILKARARSVDTVNGADRQKPRDNGSGLDSLGGGNLLFEED